jgi:hypothetical protein
MLWRTGQAGEAARHNRALHSDPSVKASRRAPMDAIGDLPSLLVRPLLSPFPLGTVGPEHKREHSWEQVSPIRVKLGMSAQIVKLWTTSDPLEAGEGRVMGPIDQAYVRLVYCMAGWPDRPAIHRFEAMEADRLGAKLLTE